MRYTGFVPGFPEIVTPRLKLWMPPGLQGDRALAYFSKNREHLEPWEPARPDGFYSRGFWEVRLEQNRDEYAAGTSMRLFVEYEGHFIGTCNFSNIVRGAFQACHLGYAVAADRQGKGLMFEALNAALPFAFEHLGVHRIMANYQPHNLRSGRLLRRLDFVVEGYARDYLFIGGAWRDHVLTARINPAF